MAQKLSLPRLREEIARHHGLSGSDKQSYIVADKIVQYCTENKIADPFAGDDAVFLPTHFESQIFLAWQVAKPYLLARIPAPEAVAEATIWEMEGSVAFETEAANLFAAHFIRARDTGSEDAPLLYRIEDWDKRQVAPIRAGKKDDLRIIMGSVAAPILAAQGVGLPKGRLDAMILAHQLKAPTLSPRPVLLGQPDDLDQWCLHRATIRPDEAVLWPRIAQFTDRLNDPEAFCAFIYGIYSGRYKGRQMLYIFDQRGEGGKSALVRMLMEQLFGTRISMAYPASALNAKGEHTSHAFVDRLLVVAGDNKNAWVLHSAMLKELSGSDPSFVNQKFMDPRMELFQCKVIVMGNCEPAILSDVHNTSRTLYLKLAPLLLSNAERDPLYAQKCVAELPGFLAWGKRCYEQRCPSGNDYAIEVNIAVRHATEQRIAVCETQYSAPFEEYFTADIHGSVSSKEWAAACKELRFDNNKSEDFREWVVARAGAVVVSGKAANGRAVWHIEGLRRRSLHDDFNIRPLPFHVVEDPAVTEME